MSLLFARSSLKKVGQFVLEEFGFGKEVAKMRYLEAVVHEPLLLLARREGEKILVRQEPRLACNPKADEPGEPFVIWTEPQEVEILVDPLNWWRAGEILTYTIEVTDGSETDTQTVQITIDGTNDAPVITVEAGDSAAEILTETDAGLTVADTLTLTDIDTTNIVTSTVLSVVESGDTSAIANATLLAMMSVTGDLTNLETTDTLDWTFDSGTEAFDYLAAGESLVLTYTIEVTDSSSATAPATWGAAMLVPLLKP